MIAPLAYLLRKLTKEVNSLKSQDGSSFPNHKKIFHESGSFTAPRTCMYKITLKGGGGGGGTYGYQNGARGAGYFSGGGGGEGGEYTFYEPLTKGNNYSFTIGAGGKGGINNHEHGNTGGLSSFDCNGNEYRCYGGGPGLTANDVGSSGGGGDARVNGKIVRRGAPGTPGQAFHAYANAGGSGGGAGGGVGSAGGWQDGYNGCGGSGSGSNATGNTYPGGNGGDGFIIFEWYDPDKINI